MVPVRLRLISPGLIPFQIDYNHPALGQCFGPGCLVAYGTDFVGDAYNDEAYDQDDPSTYPVPDDDPMDCNGHGTHVAGIVAAQADNPFGILGGSPGVTLGAYKVFGCDGSVSNDILIASYNQAYEDGNDIITASIGGASGWSEDPWAVAVQRIVEAGVPCTVAAGNSGDVGLFYASTAANGKLVTAIASADNTLTPALLSASSYSIDGGDVSDFGWTPGSPDAWAGVELPLWALNFDTTTPDDACEAFPDDTPDLSGYIVLLRRGTCNYDSKATNAAAKGAKYVMLYNNVAGAVAVNVSTVDGIEAIGMTLPSYGETWITALAAGSEVVLSMTDPEESDVELRVVDNTVTGGSLSSFTSWGPTFEMDVKPQFTAVGGQILSTYPLAKGGYAVLSGTSMATPLAAAIYALVGQVRGTLDPKTIENILAETSKPIDFNFGTGALPYLAPVPQQGAGLVQAYDAAFTTILLSVSSLSFNDSANFAESLSFEIANMGDEEVSFELGDMPALSAATFTSGDPYPLGFGGNLTDVYATLEFSDVTVSVPAGGKAVVDVSVTPPALPAELLPVYSGFVTLNGTDGSSFILPYQGVVGNLHDQVTVVDAWMTTSKDEELEPVAANSTFLLPPQGSPITSGNFTLPKLVVDAAFGTAYARADLVPLTTCPPSWTEQVLGINTIGMPDGFDPNYRPRGGSTVTWDGQLTDGQFATAGKYKIVVKGLRVFGDRDDIEEYDIVETQSFRITYS